MAAFIVWLLHVTVYAGNSCPEWFAGITASSSHSIEYSLINVILEQSCSVRVCPYGRKADGGTRHDRRQARFLGGCLVVMRQSCAQGGPSLSSCAKSSTMSRSAVFRIWVTKRPPLLWRIYRRRAWAAAMSALRPGSASRPGAAAPQCTLLKWCKLR